MGITEGTTEHAACRDCGAGRPHCHGTLIRHGAHAAHCTEPECSHPEVLLHSLVVDCEAIGCPCGAEENRDDRLAI